MVHCITGILEAAIFVRHAHIRRHVFLIVLLYSLGNLQAVRVLERYLEVKEHQFGVFVDQVIPNKIL